MDHQFEDAIRGITSINQLLVWLIGEHRENKNLQHSFLLAYRAFFSIDVIIDSLTALHNTKLTGNQCKEFLFLWVEHYYLLDWKKNNIVPRMLEFSKSIMSPEDLFMLKNMCIKDMHSRRNHHVHSVNIVMNPKTDYRRSPKPFANIWRPKSASVDATKEWNLIPANTFATQLTVMEQELFCDVQPSEFLKESWQTPHRESLAPRLSALVKRFNEVSYWVATQIVTCPTVKLQTMAIRKFIKVAYKLFKFHNYNSLMQIMSGLHNTSVNRLKSAWAALPGNTTDKFKRMNEFMDSGQNFQQYREIMNECATTKVPALPYLVLFMRDVTFIEENSDKTADGNVNFLKIFRIGGQLNWFQQFTRVDYGFTLDISVQKVLMEMKALTDAELYNYSLLSEPRTISAHVANIVHKPAHAPEERDCSPPTKRVTWRPSSPCWGTGAS